MDINKIHKLQKPALLTSLMMFFAYTLSAFQAKIEENAAPTQSDEVMGFLGDTFGMSATQTATILNSLVIAVVVLFALLIFVFYRLSIATKVVSNQKTKILAQHKALEAAKVQMKKVFRQEKAIRQKLESTNHNLKSAQTQLIHAEKMSSLGQLTAGIAHEINNPVGFIKGGVQTLKVVVGDLYHLLDRYESIEIDDHLKENIEQHRLESTEQLAECKEMITQLFKDTLFGTERVMEIVNGLRVFSRHDEAKIKSSNLVENLEAAIMILKHKTKNHAEIVKQFDPNVGEIDCYPGQLNQVFINLISNAVDAFDGFGTIIISTHDLGDKIQLSFKDDGCGIPEEIAGKIFDPFFSTKDVGEGTGLGLSISHSIIEQHKGKIEVFSKVGNGTEFRITLWKRLQEEDEKGNHEEEAEYAMLTS